MEITAHTIRRNGDIILPNGRRLGRVGQVDAYLLGKGSGPHWIATRNGQKFSADTRRAAVAKLIAAVNADYARIG